MKPLFVLLGAFLLSLVGIRLVAGSFDYLMAGRIAMSVMLVFTAIGHFAFTKGMSMMLPDFIPFKKEIIYVTDVIEILTAVGLLIPSISALTAWLLILVFHGITARQYQSSY